MTPEEAQEYTESLGQIVAGSWRQIAWAQRNGIPEALGLTTKQWVQERLGGHVRLAVPERTQAIIELRQDGFTYDQINGVLGVGNNTIADAVAVDEQPQVPTLSSADQDEQPQAPTLSSADQDEQPQAPEVDLTEYWQHEALTKSQEAFGKAIHTLAIYHDAPEARKELITEYQLPGLPVNARDLKNAKTALEGFYREWSD